MLGLNTRKHDGKRGDHMGFYTVNAIEIRRVEDKSIEQYSIIVGA